MYEIIEKEQEPSGKWRIKAIVSPDESMFLWFDVEPEQQYIDTAIDNQLRQRALSAPVIEVSQSLSCSAWQIRKLLNQLGLRDTVESMVTASSDQTTIDGWEYATVINRYDPLIIQFGATLSKTESELDSLFELAKTL